MHNCVNCVLPCDCGEDNVDLCYGCSFCAEAQDDSEYAEDEDYDWNDTDIGYSDDDGTEEE